MSRRGITGTICGETNVIKVTISQAQARLPDLLTAAAAGECVEIWVEGGRSFRLEVIPGPPNPKATNPNWLGYPHPGSCTGLIDVPDDFDEPLEEMKEYME
jgi:antitoxin (DNA-binding transcriptional repressor) of toxin-antitoxin stability system